MMMAMMTGFRSTGLMNETVRKCFKCKKDVYPARIIPPSVDLERKPRRGTNKAKKYVYLKVG